MSMFNNADKMLSQRSQSPSVYTVWFHSYEIQEQVQLNNSDRDQNGVYFWWRRILTKKRHNDTFRAQ